MISALHDAIDDQEDLRDEAGQILERVKAEVPQIADRFDTFEEILEAVAQRVEELLADLTTKAARKGRVAGKKIASRPR